MLSIDPSQQGDRDNYKLLIGSIVPRPIAFVTTLTDDGIINGAPFSYFSIVSSTPPMISLAIQRKNGVMKDTARNARSTGELVVHIVDESNVQQVNETAANLPSHESEIKLAGMTPVPSETIHVPGIIESKIRMECVLEHAFELGGTPDSPGMDLLIARIVRFHFEDDIIQDGRIDVHKLAPISRMAGNYYSKLGELFEIERPL
ncbi:flavin reductase (DIM6/NTAB) family NADH-FMN oxidoreductase RutF [Paenibacillus taihuensis]|uniref:Flavin reductase (DIM6/NTAB) family NADH-FMN oxidoreductase RutF n=1 Tax=Paenibacillus taihuensis TaxID=1156355 RepID=A0A3D9R1N1_9BACL|nr:flavin reductase family protein [Paenibacillus taihuensis]REE68128.1 flavin reductase (DIM6/NTAB) family NADH-FMN oxidoreductase RutF [Paenibacillus taihuensis]